MDEQHDGEGTAGQTTECPAAATGPGTGPVPAAGESLATTEEVIFLEPGQEKARNIVRAMSPQNAGEVVQILSREGPLRMSDIAGRLNISLHRAKYHIDNLTAAGILEIANTRYSVKGKKVKIYRLKNQVFIVAPQMNSMAQVRSALLKYGAALSIFIIAFCAVLLQPFVSLPAVPLQLSGSIRPGSSVPAAVMTTDSGIIPALIIAAAVTLVLLVAYEMHTFWKTRRYPS